MRASSLRPVFDKAPYLTSFVAGIVASLSLPPVYLMPAFLLMGWVLWQAAHAQRLTQALMHIALGAYGWFLVSLYWISHSLLVGDADYWFLLPLSFFGIPMIVTFFWIAGAVAGYLFAKTPQGRIMMMVAFIGLAEWGREFIATGFPWNAPGLIMLGTSPTASLAAYFGQTGLTFIVLSAAAIWPVIRCLSTLTQRRFVIGLVVIVSCGLAGLSYHHHQIAPQQPLDDTVSIRLVQPAVPQAEKWQLERRNQHLTKLTGLSIAPAERPVDVVIWPETAFAGDYNQEADRLGDLVQQIRNHHLANNGAGQLLTGVLQFDGKSQLRNAALLIAEDGSTAIYHKTHLVPFGEYVPFRGIPFIDAIAGPIDFVPGQQVRPLFVPHLGLVLPLICYEAIFPALTGRATERPAVIVNLTNDGWFGHTAGPYQHLAQTRMTAISYGIAVIRVANTGISGVFDGKGKKGAQIGLGETAMIDIPRPAIYAPTYFARFGWLMAAVLFGSCVIGAMGLDLLRQKRQ